MFAIRSHLISFQGGIFVIIKIILEAIFYHILTYFFNKPEIYPVRQIVYQSLIERAFSPLQWPSKVKKPNAR